MKRVLMTLFVSFVVSAFAEKQPFERYQPIVDRQMFGQPPVGFDPTKPPSEVTKSEQRELTKEQETLKSAIHFSMINVTPDGSTAVGFTDNSDPKAPVHYYLKVGEKRNGWEVKEADPIKATMTVAKGDLVVPLELGANSASAGKAAASGAGAAGGVPGRGGRRVSLLSGAGLSGGGVNGAAAPGGPRPLLVGGSIRERRQAREQERLAAAAQAEAKEKAEAAKRAEEREAQRQELQNLKDELNAQREAMALEKAEREAKERAERQSEPKDKDASDAGDES